MLLSDIISSKFLNFINADGETTDAIEKFAKSDFVFIDHVISVYILFFNPVHNGRNQYHIFTSSLA